MLLGFFLDVRRTRGREDESSTRQSRVDITYKSVYSRVSRSIIYMFTPLPRQPPIPPTVFYMFYLIPSLPESAGDDSWLVCCEEIRWDVPDMALLFRMLGCLETDNPPTRRSRQLLLLTSKDMFRVHVSLPCEKMASRKLFEGFCKNNSKILNVPYLSSLIQCHPHSHFFISKIKNALYVVKKKHPQSSN